MRSFGRGFQPIFSDIRLGAIRSNPVPIREIVRDFSNLSWKDVTPALPFTAAEWDGVILVIIEEIFIEEIFIACGAGEA
jgi:hypothetical protein